MEPNETHKALNLASVSTALWGVCTHTHVFRDIFVCSRLLWELYILTVGCHPKKFEKNSSLKLIFWTSVNFPAWLPFYFEQGLDFLILFLTCNRISQPQHHRQFGLNHFLVCVCVFWGWVSVQCRVFSSIPSLSLQGASSTFPQLRQSKMSPESA